MAKFLTMKSEPIPDFSANERTFFIMQLTTCRGPFGCTMGGYYALVSFNISIVNTIEA